MLCDRFVRRLVEFHPEALAEFEEAAKYYETQEQGLGHEFVTAIDEQVQRLLENSALGQPVGQKGLRRSVNRRFPYSLFYHVTAERLLILAVAHQHRRPGYWRYRL